MKIQDGESIRIRILSNPEFMWRWWTVDKKPLPVAYDGSLAKTPAGADPKGKSQFIWNVIVYNYNEDLVQIWNISQKSIQGDIEKFSKDNDFGDPQTYDLKISRTGKTMADTEYTTIPMQKAENMKELDKDILVEASQINLKALLTNDNPFDDVVMERQPKDTIADTAKAVF